MCCCNNKKLVVFGSGRTGTAAAYACGMLDNFKEIMIIDTNKSKAIGKAIDIQQGLILQNKDTLVNGTDDVKQIKGADVIIITASVPHAAKPGLDVREVLLHGNRPLITKLATDIFGVVPAGTKQPLIIILTNPMDLILSQFIKTAKKVTNNKVDLKKVVGSGNWLDTARLKYYLSRAYNVAPSTIESYAVAQHGLKIVYLLSQTKINGELIETYIKTHKSANGKLLSMDDLLKVIDEARFGGQTIIKYVGNSDSTVYGPGISLQVLANAYLNDTKEKVVVSTWCDGQYGVQDFAFGVPVIMGKNGVEKILDLKISKQDQQNYDTSYRFSLELDRQKEKS